MNFKTSCIHRFLLAGVTSMVIAVASSPIATAEEPPKHFDIKAKPLAEALMDYGAQSGTVIVAPTQVTAGKTAKPVSGDMPAADALRRLLEGSGLKFSKGEDGTVVILRQERSARGSQSSAAVPLAQPGDTISSQADYPRSEGSRSESQGVKDSATNAGSNLDEIIVIARRREENVQSVPIAITVVTQENIRERNIQSISDLQYYVPSLNVTPQGLNPDFAPITIRGQGGFSPGGSPAVITYIDEVPVPTSGFSDVTGARYYDLQSVQVLKGPQGTLFGRNTTGGAVLMQSTRPTNRFEGYLEGTVGNYGDRDFDFAVNVPIVDDKVLFRVAGQRLSRDGYAYQLATPHHPNGIDQGNRDVWSGRATLTVRPNDGVQNDIIVDTNSQRDHGIPYFLTAVNPAGFAALIFPEITGILAQQQALGPRSIVPSDTDSADFIRTSGVDDILRIDVTKDIMFRNIFGYQRVNSGPGSIDYDATTVPILDFTASGASKSQQITEEPQLQGKSFNGNLSWTIGAFYLRTTPRGSSPVGTSIIFGGVSQSTGRGDEKSVGGYAQGTYDLSGWHPGLKFTAGYRYTHDERAFSGITGGVATSGSAKFGSPSWTLGLDYQLKPDMLVYIASRHSYRAGGFNQGVMDPKYQTFTPEHVTDIETGIKADWNLAGMKAQTNIALYYQWYKGLQLVETVFDPVFIQVTGNGGDAKLWGAEFEGRLNPIDDLTLTTAFSYFHEKITQLNPAVNPAMSYYWPRYPPAYQVTLGARYHLPMQESWGNISVSANWHWLSKVTTSNDFVPEPFDTVGPYGLLSLNADWNQILGRPIDASFFMTNATDKKYLAQAVPLYQSLGFSAAVSGAPRLFGLRLRYRFGAER